MFKKFQWKSSLADTVEYFLLLPIAAAFGFFISSLIRLPVGHDYGIKSPYGITGFSPSTNLVVLLLSLIVTAALYVILLSIRRTHAGKFRMIVVGLFTASFLFGSAIPTIASAVGNIDMFHHGEQLSPALAFLNGKTPYSDLGVLHGAGEDVIIPAASFVIFGRSIGSYLLLTSLLQTVAYGLFFVLLSRLFKPNWLFLLIGSWFAVSIYSSVYYVRDIAVWASIFIAYLLITRTLSKKQRIILPAVLGIIGCLSLFNSIDRGQILLFFNAVVVLVVTFQGFKPKKTIRLSLTPAVEHLKRHFQSIGLLIAGYVAPLIVIIPLLGLSGFGSFLRSSFIDIPRYQGLMFSHPYPPLSPGTLIYYVPYFLLGTLLLLVAFNYREIIKYRTPSVVFGFVVLVLGVAFLKAASGRPDEGHLTYATPVLFLAIFYLLYSFQQSKIRLRTAPTPVFILLGVALLIFSPIYSLERIGALRYSDRAAIKTALKAPRFNDNYWLTPDSIAVKDYIITHSKSNDGLFVFASEPAYYYLTSRPNPTKYYISWFMDPAPFEAASLDKLKQNPPKFIIYKTNTAFYDNPDDVSMTDRLPLIDQWITSTYKKKITIGKALILTR